MRSKTHEIDMCSGAIFPKLILFAIPLILSGILQLFFNAADMIVVGKFGSENSLAAVGSTSSLINILLNLFLGLSVGVNTVVARRYGAGDMKGVSNSVHTAVLLSFISGLIVTVLGIITSRPLLVAMSTPEEVIDLSDLYVKIYYLGMPFNMFFNFGSAILRALGDTKRPLYYLTISGVLNVVLNLILVVFFRMDVAGVAFATVASNILSAGLVFLALVRHQGAARLYPKEIRIYKREFLQIIQIGIPAGIQSCVFSISNVLVQSAVNYLGTATMNACAAAGSIEGFIYIGMNCFYQAVLSFVSQNYGRQNFVRIKKIILEAIFLVTAFGLILGILVVIFHEPLLKLYIKDGGEAVMRLGFERLIIVATLYFLCGNMEVLVGGLRGMGQSLLPMISALVGVCGGRILWILVVFERVKDMTEGIFVFGIHLSRLQVLIFAWPVAWIATIIMHSSALIYIYKKNVNRVKNLENIKVVKV